ncbi:MAG: GspH/FimT family pseudopilin [Steroidobacter sp.]
MRNAHGVTLIEMLTALTVISVIGALAMPSFGNLLRDAQRTAAVNDFFHALFLARSESIKRGVVVSLCKTQDQETCANRGTEWTGGWLVFVNSDRDELPERDPEEAVLAVYQGWPNGRITSNRLAYSFRPYVQGVVNGTIVFCDARGPEHARAIIISHTGRPRIARRDSSNRLLQCPVT